MTAQPGTETPAIKTWQRIVTLSTLAIAVALGALLLVIGEPIPPIIAFALVFLLVAGLLWRFGGGRRWPWVTVAVLSVLALLSDMEHLLYDLSHPEEFGPFVINVVTIAAVVLIALGGFVIGTRRALATRPVLLGAGAVVVVATVFSLSSALTLETHEREPGDILFVSERNEFPERFEIGSGPQWVYLDNRDRIRHTFVIDALGINVDMPGSAGRRAELNLEPGEYEFYCDVPGHETAMRGTLVVAGGQTSR